ncbi:hypothetical protein FDA33_00945 [Clostridium botulinum]|nr:hypothetical protein [Clostridium botulinum]NFI19637.1 hypothetical protein [Clostridium botulinum]NFL92075.1 hypothetical protein [Clostridium botulinum]NFN50327.1 hypothetical protein [Clostridium botulinum]NFO25929.1 hypothetical protein [Clostridium botulinum]
MNYMIGKIYSVNIPLDEIEKQYISKDEDWFYIIGKFANVFNKFLLNKFNNKNIIDLSCEYIEIPKDKTELLFLNRELRDKLGEETIDTSNESKLLYAIKEARKKDFYDKITTYNIAKIYINKHKIIYAMNIDKELGYLEFIFIYEQFTDENLLINKKQSYINALFEVTECLFKGYRAIFKKGGVIHYYQEPFKKVGITENGIIEEIKLGEYKYIG